MASRPTRSDAVALQDGGLAGTDAVQILHGEQGEPVGSVGGLDGQHTARPLYLRRGGRGQR
ncbi:hypothetical protein [Streptomyces sp. Ag109_O5-10]|uniref:hypothetical protein n=1 Tax=Streptomyces sp. Ag109_O5-10 TaxID=1855349 RepID=UPI003524A139